METIHNDLTEAAFEGIGLLEMFEGDPILGDILDDEKCWIYTF